MQLSVFILLIILFTSVHTQSSITWLIDSQFTAGQYHTVLMNHVSISSNTLTQPVKNGTYNFTQIYNKALNTQYVTVIIGLTSINYTNINGAIGFQNVITKITATNFVNSVTVYTENSIVMLTFQYLAFRNDTFNYLTTAYYQPLVKILNQSSGDRTQTFLINSKSIFPLTLDQTHFYVFLCNYFIDPNGGHDYNIDLEVNYQNSTFLKLIASTKGTTLIKNFSVFITCYDNYFINQTFFGRFFQFQTEYIGGAMIPKNNPNWPLFNYRSYIIGMNSIQYSSQSKTEFSFNIRQDYINALGNYKYIRFDQFQYLGIGCLTGIDKYYLPQTDKCVNPCPIPLVPNLYKFCQICSYTCDMCISPIKCYNCTINSSRTIINNQCLCNSHYFDDGSNTECKMCDYKCLNCFVISTNCTSCTLNRNYISDSCLCKIGSYDDGKNQECKLCSQKCQTCQINQDNCLSCNQNNYRILINNTCQCQTSFIQQNNLCIACSYSCVKCLNLSLNSCITCDVSTRIYNNLTLTCDCLIGYFDNNANYFCIKCYYACQKCIRNADYCISCPKNSNRILINNSCQCPNGFYDLGFPICNTTNQSLFNIITCSYTCQTCKTRFSCQTCSNFSNRVFNSTNNLCSCIKGFYDDGINELCLQICGDGMSLSNSSTSCDDGNIISGDGCNSICQIQLNFSCTKNKSRFSNCVYNQPISISIQSIQKSQYSNQIDVIASITPPIKQLNSLNFSQVMNISNVGNSSIKYTYSQGLINIKINYNQNIDSKLVSINFDPSLKSNSFKVSSSYNFSLVTSNNQAANIYSSSIYQKAKQFSVLMKAIAYISLIVYIISFIFNRIIGIELMEIIQLGFLSISYIQYVSPILAGFGEIKYVNGVNSIYNMGVFQVFSNKIRSLGYKVDFIDNFNLMFLLLVLIPLFLTLVYGLILKKLDYSIQNIKKIAKSVILCSYFNLLVFNFYQIVFSTTIYIKYNSKNNQSSNILQIVAIWLIIFTLIILTKFQKKSYFPLISKDFKLDPLSHNYIYINLIYRFIMSVLLASLNQSAALPYIIILIPAIYLAFIIYQKPYFDLFNNIRIIINTSITIIYLIYYSSITLSPSKQYPQQSVKMMFPFAISGLLILAILVNIIGLSRSIQLNFNEYYLDLSPQDVLAKQRRIQTEQSGFVEQAIREQGININNTSNRQDKIEQVRRMET